MATTGRAGARRAKATRGDKKIIDLLNDILTAELTGVNQYFLHAKMCENWGYLRLHRKTREAAIGEMKHADEIIERILFLEGIPNVQRLGRVSIGESVPEQMKLDMALEAEAIERLNTGIALCTELGDAGSRELLASILEGEEEHLGWLEAQLGIIATIGEAGYLAQQIDA
jgi:bacterioferritin